MLSFRETEYPPIIFYTFYAVEAGDRKPFDDDTVSSIGFRVRVSGFSSNAVFEEPAILTGILFFESKFSFKHNGKLILFYERSKSNIKIREIFSSSIYALKGKSRSMTWTLKSSIMIYK